MQMLQKGTLAERFQPYRDDIQKCRDARAYWALLHVTVCMPDICAALQASDGEAKPARYRAWCDLFAVDPLLTGEERWLMRCKVLHQGRAQAGKTTRYSSYSFGQPAETGEIDHKRVEATTLHLDVGELAREIEASVARWIDSIEANPGSPESMAVEKNLVSLVQVSRVPVIQPASRSGFAIFSVNKTY